MSFVSRRLVIGFVLLVAMVFTYILPIAAQGETGAAPSGESVLLSEIRQAAQPLTGNPDDYRPLLESIGDARIVLIGEASHGTHEFYQARAQITEKLIEEKGFTAVAVEADW